MARADIERITDQDLTLAATYPYLAWLAAPLIARRPDWFEEFRQSEYFLAELDQARNFAFVAFAEQMWPGEFYPLAATIIEEGPEYLTIELANTADWYDTSRRG